MHWPFGLGLNCEFLKMTCTYDAICSFFNPLNMPYNIHMESVSLFSLSGTLFKV